MSRIKDYEPESVADELRGYAFAGNGKRALSGRKGQKFLRELEAALVALPSKRLTTGALAVATGDVCALGAVAVARAVASGRPRPSALQDLAEKFDPEAYTGWELSQESAHLLKICHPLAYEVIYQNDEGHDGFKETPEARYERVLTWVRSQIRGT